MLILKEMFSFIEFHFRENFPNKSRLGVTHFPRTHYSIVPLFQSRLGVTNWGEAPKFAFFIRVYSRPFAVETLKMDELRNNLPGTGIRRCPGKRMPLS
jgi:hypothetical protein